MAKIDARDNDCVGRSPCIGCERENEDKRKCASTCELLAAYRGGTLLEEKEDMMNDEHRTSNEKEIKTKDQRQEKVQKKMCLRLRERCQNPRIEQSLLPGMGAGANRARGLWEVCSCPAAWKKRR